MEKTVESSSQYTRRHLSQLKILSRLFEHELELAKGEEVVLDKALVESTLDTLEIFIEDVDGSSGRAAGDRKAARTEAKPQVTRLK